MCSNSTPGCGLCPTGRKAHRGSGVEARFPPEPAASFLSFEWWRQLSAHSAESDEAVFPVDLP